MTDPAKKYLPVIVGGAALIVAAASLVVAYQATKQSAHLRDIEMLVDAMYQGNDQPDGESVYKVQVVNDDRAPVPITNEGSGIGGRSPLWVTETPTH